MVTKPEDDERLSEVKLILQSFQQNGSDHPLAATTVNKPKPNASALESLTKRQTRGASAQKKRLGAFALATIATGTVAMLASEMFLKYWPADPTSQTATASAPVPLPAARGAVQTAVPSVAAAPPAPPSPAVTSAKKMMDSGKITAARELLMQPFLASTQDGAWLIARSYDPNYLASVASPDAVGDKAKAAEWYGRWRDIGARNGVPMDNAQLRRLVESLD
jgi:hypothetical protein